jgi:hypothetical protein
MKQKRKRRFRGLMALLLALAVLTGVAQSSTTVTVEAASKLTKKDFISKGKYGANFYKEHKTQEGAVSCTTMVGETEKASKILRTNRGIDLASSKSKVIKKYGKTKAQKVNVKTDNTYYALKKLGVAKSELNVIKKAKYYLDYKTTIGGSEYRLRFYLDKSNTVVDIAYLKNYDSFRSLSWS